MANLTPEQKRTVFYEGGLRETVTLAGHTLVLGELALRDKYKIFECMEGDLAQVERTWHEYIGSRARGVIGWLVRTFRDVIGLEEKRAYAIGAMKRYIDGLTDNDVRLIQICAAGRNQATPEQVKEIVLSAPTSEVQPAIQKALEINGIDLKKFMAAQPPTTPADAARKTMTSTAGSAE